MPRVTGAAGKTCGGANHLCDATVTTPDGLTISGSGGGDDFTPGQIEFPAICSDVKVPQGGPYRNQTVTTLADLVECVDEFKVDCIERARLPALAQ